jgi:hypothetical protein
MIMDKKLILLLVGVILISGCIGQQETPPEKLTSDREKAISECKQECNSKLKANEDLSNGPCLLDPIADLPDWVCDVAHKPRQDVDNQPVNQCGAFREGRANHFVEVDINCEIIQIW